MQSGFINLYFTLIHCISHNKTKLLLFSLPKSVDIAGTLDRKIDYKKHYNFAIVTMPVKLKFCWLAIIVFVFVVLIPIPERILESILMPLTLATTRATLTLIHLIGIDATRSGMFVSHPDGFVYQITYRCTGIIPATVFCVWVLVFPKVPFRLKLVGFGIGLPILAAFNLLRLVHLFYVGIYSTSSFDLAHEVIWQSLIVLQIVGLCLGWALWSVSQQQKYHLLSEAPTSKFGYLSP